MFFLRFRSFPTVKSILRLKSHGNNAHSLLCPQIHTLLDLSYLQSRLLSLPQTTTEGATSNDPLAASPRPLPPPHPLRDPTPKKCHSLRRKKRTILVEEMNPSRSRKVKTASNSDKPIQSSGTSPFPKLQVGRFVPPPAPAHRPPAPVPLAQRAFPQSSTTQHQDHTFIA